MNSINQNCDPEATCEAAQSGTSGSRRLRILSVISEKECADNVIACILNLRAMNLSFEVFLLNVQPSPETGRLRGYGTFKENEIRDRIIDVFGRPILAYAGKQLDGAGIEHRDLIKLGDPAETILNCAREEKCDLILLSEAAPGKIRQWLMRSAGISIGSVASVVLGFSEAPVLVVR
jgi:nucleotide-binding universal stress UspA family protein